MSPFRIVPASPADADELVALENCCFARPTGRERLCQEISAADSVFLVARDTQGRLLGYAGYRRVLDEGSIDNIAVFPQARRQGVARALLETLCDSAREQKLAFLTLEVRQSNEAALSLYESMDFSRQGLRRGYYDQPREDALLLTRFFSPDAGMAQKEGEEG